MPPAIQAALTGRMPNITAQEGGGAGVSGSTSGTGGDGAPGYVIIEW